MHFKNACFFDQKISFITDKKYEGKNTMQHLTIREIKEALEHQPVDQSLMNQLKADSRKGVQKIAKALEQKEKKKKEQEIQWHKMMTIERDLYDQGYSSVEIGRASCRERV